MLWVYSTEFEVTKLMKVSLGRFIRWQRLTLWSIMNLRYLFCLMTQWFWFWIITCLWESYPYDGCPVCSKWTTNLRPNKRLYWRGVKELKKRRTKCMKLKGDYVEVNLTRTCWPSLVVSLHTKNADHNFLLNKKKKQISWSKNNMFHSSTVNVCHQARFFLGH